MGQSQVSAKPGRGFKEFIRKFLVSLKRKPQNIALFVLLVGFVFFSLNLTSISDTTALINTDNMGQCEFAMMLFSILSFVVFLRTFPKRQKVKIPMLILTFLFLGIVVFADVVYLSRISDALTREENRIIINYETGQNLFIANAWSTLITFLIFMAAVVVLLAALPLYSKLLRKINTSIDVEGNTNMTTVDISEED
ncbi:MAG TPA: hypothetical protein DEQ68_04195 [Ruminococcaceae bacterium]|nr:hypothetical protein [Oscillospiraceae bacterium]